MIQDSLYALHVFAGTGVYSYHFSVVYEHRNLDLRSGFKRYSVVEFQHVKPGKGNTIMRTTLKDVVSGRVLERRFNIGEALEDVRVERRPYQYLYQEGDDYIFMNQETYEQVPIAHDLITGVDFLKEGFVCDVVSDASTDTILFAELPTKVELTVAYTEWIQWCLYCGWKRPCHRGALSSEASRGCQG